MPHQAGASPALAALRERFRLASAATVLEFERAAARLAESPGDTAELRALEERLHRLRGTAGSYGFPAASELAGALERRVIRWLADEALERESRPAIIACFSVALRGAFAEASAG